LIFEPVALPERKRKITNFWSVVLFHNLVPKCDANAGNAVNLVSGKGCPFCPLLEKFFLSK
jgi:hypothetical protein